MIIRDAKTPKGRQVTDERTHYRATTLRSPGGAGRGSGLTWREQAENRFASTQRAAAEPTADIQPQHKYVFVCDNCHTEVKVPMSGYRKWRRWCSVRCANAGWRLKHRPPKVVPRRMAPCHTKEPYYARDLCKSCYQKHVYREHRAKIGATQ